MKKLLIKQYDKNIITKPVLEISAVTGFTLAEVLITLLIIGVVASLVIPQLVQDTQRQEYIIAYKKAYADLSNALKQSLDSYELSACTGKFHTACHQNNFNAIKSKFNITKECTGTENRMPCWAEGGNFWAMPDTRYSNFSYFIDNMGRSWANAAAEPWIFVDTNGLKGPNINGLDRFEFVPVSDSINQYNGCDDLPSLVGMPVKIAAQKDHTSVDSKMCPSGNCLYTSWLKQ